MPVDPTALAELHQRLADQLTALTTGDEWLRFLHASRQFHRYSARNQMLLALQGAEGHVASYKTWQRIPAQDGGTCQVRKGEHGLIVLAPITTIHRDVDEITGDERTDRQIRGFKPVKVFHQGQLVSPPDLPNPPLPQLLTGENRHQHIWAAVQSHLEDLGYTVTKVNRSPAEQWNGRTNFADLTVEISDHLQPPAAVKTLLHEWAHIALGHDTRLIDRRHLQEVEAESVAYLLCGTVRIDSAQYSVPYLATWSRGDPQLLHDTAERTLTTTADLIGVLEAELSVDLTPDPLTAARYPDTIDLVAPIESPAVDKTLGGVVRFASPPTPILDHATGELRSAMAGLANEHDRQRLLTALSHLDHQLAIALELFADAGFNPARTAHFLLNDVRIDPEILVAAMVLDEIDHHPLQPDLSADEQERIRADLAAAVHRLNVNAPGSTATHRYRLSDGDRHLLAQMDLTQHAQLTQATRTVADAGLDIDAARDALAKLGVAESEIDSVLQCRHYNPATGHYERLWPSVLGTLAPEDPEQLTLPTPPARQMVRRVANTSEPPRLARDNDTNGRNNVEAIRQRVDADGGVNDVVVADAPIANRNSTHAATDLLQRTAAAIDEDPPTAPTATPPPTTAANVILREWDHMRPPPTNAPRLA